MPLYHDNLLNFEFKYGQKIVVLEFCSTYLYGVRSGISYKSIGSIFVKVGYCKVLDVKHFFINLSMRSREKLYKSIIKEYEDQNLLLGKILHEYIAQDLYAIQLTLQRYSIEQGHSLPIDQVEDIVNGTIGKVQQMANDLFPIILRDLGFERAVEDLFLHYNAIKNVLLVEDEVNHLDFRDQHKLFQLVQFMLKALFMPHNPCLLVIKLMVNKNMLLLEMGGATENYIREFENCNKEIINKLEERVNLFDGTLDINTSSDSNRVVVIVKLN